MKIHQESLKELESNLKFLTNHSSKRELVILVLRVGILFIRSEDLSLLSLRGLAIFSMQAYSNKHPEIVNQKATVEEIRDYCLRKLADTNEQNIYLHLRYIVHALILPIG